MTSSPHMPKPTYPQKFGNESMQVLGAWNMPKNVLKLYGCISCEWRGTPLCAFKFKKGRGIPNKKNCHANGICVERVNYLKSFYTGPKKKPTYLEWRECYTRAMAHMQMDKDYIAFQKLGLEIEKLESQKSKTETSSERLLIIKEKHYQYKSSWFQMMKHLSKLESDVIKRDTPKKIEIEQRISLTQIHKIVEMSKNKKEVQDGEYIESRSDDGELE